jgi:hypothetical protein
VAIGVTKADLWVDCALAELGIDHQRGLLITYSQMKADIRVWQMNLGDKIWVSWEHSDQWEVQRALVSRELLINLANEEQKQEDAVVYVVTA